MKLTPESLLALTKSPEGLEQLRIIAAEFDGNQTIFYRYSRPYHDSRIIWHSSFPTKEKADADRAKNLNWLPDQVSPVEPHVSLRDTPNYPTSLDAIFAAEERLGLHSADSWELQEIWKVYAEDVFYAVHDGFPEGPELAFLPPPLRLIVYILTAQWKEQNS